MSDAKALYLILSHHGQVYLEFSLASGACYTIDRHESKNGVEWTCHREVGSEGQYLAATESAHGSVKHGKFSSVRNLISAAGPWLEADCRDTFGLEFLKAELASLLKELETAGPVLHRVGKNLDLQHFAPR